MSDDKPFPVEEAQTVKRARREGRIVVVGWAAQSVVMVGIFILLGYHRTNDPFGFPLGLPSWYLFGGIIAGLVVLAFNIYIAVRHISDDSLD